mmetsp:Transcript_14481/g.45246  ORF Transcript_14481/g.45246 Transcript_14481/m.45246 type:complete len:515 (-) Transcript_14481:296-1840(-)
MSYMPIVAATSGTLSISALATPMIAATTSSDGNALESATASCLSRPDASSAPIAMSTPRKKRIPDVSSFESAAGTCSSSFCSSAWSASVTTHSAPRPVSMPMKGGRPVFSTKTGTESSAPTPTPSTRPADDGAGFLGAASAGGGGGTPAASCGEGSTLSCSTAIDAMSETSEHAKRSVIVCAVESWPFIHSIVVVTSPIGVHTPPALAAITIIAPKSLRSSSESRSLRMSETITIVTVKLFKMAERKKVSTPTSQKSVLFDETCSRSVNARKPWCASTTSTIVDAARRKKQMSDTSARCCESCSSRKARSPIPENSMYTAHMSVAISRPTAPLFKSNSSSKMIPTYPSTKLPTITSCQCAVIHVCSVKSTIAVANSTPIAASMPTCPLPPGCERKRGFISESLSMNRLCSISESRCTQSASAPIESTPTNDATSSRAGLAPGLITGRWRMPRAPMSRSALTIVQLGSTVISSAAGVTKARTGVAKSSTVCKVMSSVGTMHSSAGLSDAQLSALR